MKFRPTLAVFAALALSGCAVVPVDGTYYAGPPVTLGYYGSPAASHVWIGGNWSSGYRSPYGPPPNWAPGYHRHGYGPGPRPQWRAHQWNRGGTHGWRPGGHWRGGGYRRW